MTSQTACSRYDTFTLSLVMCVWHLAISGLEFQKPLLMGNSNEPYFIPFPISVDIACRGIQ